jgi:ribose transport system substrate-binding protein
MKRLTLLTLLAVLLGGNCNVILAAGPPAGAGQTSYKEKLSAKLGKKPVVAVSVLQFNNVTIQKWLGAMREASDFHGIDLRVADGQNDAARQSDQNDNFIAQKVDLILIDPVDAKGILPVVARINRASIPVINFDVRAEGGQFATFVGHDWLMSGIMSGLQIVDATGGEGNVVLVEGSPGTDAQFSRTKGIELVLSLYPKLKIVAKQPGYFNRTEGLKATESLLQAQKHIDVFYYQNDEMYFGGIKAIEAAGRRNEMKILSVDGNPEALQAIQKGDLDYEVVGQFYLQGWLVMEAAAKVLAGEQVPAVFPVKLYMADKTNAGNVPPAW